ncbi:MULTISPECIES: LysR substrate-binding domain-containing protein [Gulbenkiania]|uniref:DNA-binding transcriptional regulator, LysR family n=2 Tax=Gulbenkiania TaxID=397456 RepID=A0A0K6GTM3_9NEIS|nr:MULTISPECIES: LysR substrate-binding domain-containing protein [Gulbenkiania]TCW31761.1 DNA-binding transcriptional LysR family regulator [Gulbenkiania mobilis]CUA81886.1 DNA-binding transcriptional regulator, LysR family [Gulbenkiania indica]
MSDLNDLYYFAKVVEYGGFMAAGRALGVPKSRLSRRVAELEERLGVRLLHRTTRKLALTDLGTQYYRHCQAMLAEAEAAQETIDRARAEPRGVVRVSCPELLCKTLLAPVLPGFMQRNPQVKVWLEITNRRVDLLEEGVDVALRVRPQMEDSASLVARRLGISGYALVASPALLATHGMPRRPEDLLAMPVVAMSRPDNRTSIVLTDPTGTTQTLTFDSPRLMGDDLVLLSAAAEAGIGIGALPTLVCHEAMAAGRLVALLPEYQLPGGILHAVFPSRRGLVPAVRAFIDFLVEELVPPNHPAYDRL